MDWEFVGYGVCGIREFADLRIVKLKDTATLFDKHYKALTTDQYIVKSSNIYRNIGKSYMV